MTELETLIAQAEQFAWGPADVTADITDLHSRLKDAKQWVAQVNSKGILLSSFLALDGFWESS